MIPAGYLLKRVTPPPAWLSSGPTNIVSVCSVSSCVNDDVVDLQAVYKHNGFGLASKPEVLWGLVEKCEAYMSGAALFYYEAYEAEIESDGWVFDSASWAPLSMLASAGAVDAVARPSPTDNIQLLGFDVVVFEDFLEHSPLSCNSIANEIQVNEHCLLPTLEEAKSAIDSGAFAGGCEQGIYKIYSVNLITAFRS